jgi:large subunit ribosomal protein L2
LTKLTTFIKNRAGRNNTGSIVARFRGSRARKRLRIVSHANSFFCIPGVVLRIEYDPNRSSFISLILYKNGVCSYNIHTLGLSVGDYIKSLRNISVTGLDGFPLTFNNGDSCYLYSVPNGTVTHDVELSPFSGGVISRAAGTYCLIVKKFLNLRKSFLKMPSKQLRSFSFMCIVAKGIVSNELHNRVVFGKAGRSRLLGKKQIVRGLCQNPVDHPHGGGEGHKSKKCFPRTA